MEKENKDKKLEDRVSGIGSTIRKHAPVMVGNYLRGVGLAKGFKGIRKLNPIEVAKGMGLYFTGKKILEYFGNKEEKNDYSQTPK